jgi:hypothetical protein
MPRDEEYGFPIIDVPEDGELRNRIIPNIDMTPHPFRHAWRGDADFDIRERWGDRQED